MFDRRLLKWAAVAVFAFLILIIVLLFQRPRIERELVDEGSAPRPDVVEWIEKHYETEPRKKVALTRLAEAAQYILTHPDADSEADKKDALALACYSVAFGDDKDRVDGMPAYEALAAQSFNTSARARKRIAYDGKMSGKVLESVEIKSWEDQCEKPLWP